MYSILGISRGDKLLNVAAALKSPKHSSTSHREEKIKMKTKMIGFKLDDMNIKT